MFVMPDGFPGTANLKNQQACNHQPGWPKIIFHSNLV
jgi:hypothetical protein